MDITDVINEQVTVTSSGNMLSVLGNNYLLPTPIQYKTTNSGNSLYVTATNNGLVTEAVEVDLSLAAGNVLTPTVTYNRYFWLADNTVLNAISATVVAGSVVATVDPASAQSAGYQGDTFTLSGRLLTSKTVLVKQ